MRLPAAVICLLLVLAGSAKEAKSAPIPAPSNTWSEATIRLLEAINDIKKSPDNLVTKPMIQSGESKFGDLFIAVANSVKEKIRKTI